jgi:3-deoxy-D-manno-octulosonic-acid transferase
VSVTGSLKFDSLELPGAVPEGFRPADRGRNRVLRYFRVSPDRPIVIAASTLKGEEDPVLEAFLRIRASMPNALLVIAPRKPERFDDAVRLAQGAGYTVARRSELRVDAEPRQQVIVLDTIGELAQLFQIATVVFVGGSLVDAGGHNILEPAVFGKPIIFGPHMENFAEIAQAFLDNGAAIQIRDERELGPALTALLGDPVRRASLGAAARALVEANRGARVKSLGVLAELLPSESSRVVPFRVVH